MGWIEGRGFPIFIEGEHEVEIPGGKVGGEFSIGTVPDEALRKRWRRGWARGIPHALRRE